VDPGIFGGMGSNGKLNFRKFTAISIRIPGDFDLLIYIVFLLFTKLFFCLIGCIFLFQDQKTSKERNEEKLVESKFSSQIFQYSC